MDNCRVRAAKASSGDQLQKILSMSVNMGAIVK